MLKTNLTKERMKAGEPAFGVILPFASPALVEICGHIGFDFVLIEGEHASLNEDMCENMVRAAETMGITPLIRVPFVAPSLISRLLDIGMQGVQVAHVRSRADVEAIVRSVKYYPEGARGLSHCRAAGYGLGLPLSEYVQRANDATMIVLMIEDAEAIDELDEMLRYDAVDVVVVGPGDLSQSLGLPGEYGHPVVVETIQRIMDRVNASGKVLGSAGGDVESIRRHLRTGSKYVCIGATDLMAHAARDLLMSVRGAQGDGHA